MLNDFEHVNSTHAISALAEPLVSLIVVALSVVVYSPASAVKIQNTSNGAWMTEE